MTTRRTSSRLGIQGTIMRHNLLLGVATAALLLPGAAFAQSTGSIDFDAGSDIVVTGRADKSIGGVEIPDSTKAKGVLTQEFIARQTPGNTILDTINSLPGVSFQNNDPFGSGGGTLTIRGFDSIAHLADLRRHSAERYRQLCALFEPAARSGADRPGQCQLRLDRRRQPDRRGFGFDRQLSHHRADRQVRRAAAGLGRRL